MAAIKTPPEFEKQPKKLQTSTKHKACFVYASGEGRETVRRGERTEGVTKTKRGRVKINEGENVCAVYGYVSAFALNR